MTAFYDCCDLYQMDKSQKVKTPELKDWQTYYRWAASDSSPHGKDRGVAVSCGSMWREKMRPFYRIWPDAASMLSHTSLSVCPAQIPRQTNVVCMQMPKDQRFLDITGNSICSIIGTFLGPIEKENYWLLHIHGGGLNYFEFCINENHVLTDHIEDFKSAGDDFKNWMKLCLRMFFGSMLLASQTEMIERVLLSKDVKRGSDSEDALQRAIKRAISRGVNGFDIGRKIKIDRKSGMHVRRPHFGLRWTGKGGEIPRLVPISGCIVNIDRVKRMPEGYLDGQQSTEANP